MQDLVVNERLTIPSRDLRWRFSRSSGPGGQGVNTTDSRVEAALDGDLQGRSILELETLWKKAKAAIRAERSAMSGSD